MVDQIIGHLDMDSFYASVEMRDDPSLQGKAVVVGSDPKQGTGRGVVSTCSYEARRFGLYSGMPISQAWSLCPHAVYIRPSGKYGETSSLIMSIIHEHVPAMEQVSIDEAYLDLSFCNSYQEAESLTFTIKKILMERVHLTCSIGIAQARSYAKMASELEKPDGLVSIPPENLHSVMDSLPVSKIPGIGKKSANILHSRGIHAIVDLANIDIQCLQDIFGKYAVRVHMIASGADTSGLKEQGPCRSIGRECTFTEDTADIAIITDTFRELASVLASELKRKNGRYRTIGIRIRYTGFITQTRSKSLTHSDASESNIFRTALLLFDEFWTGELVRLVGIRVSGLSFKDKAQSELHEFIQI